MALPEGYTGPTSGRITVGGEGPAQVERFYDKPLTAEENEALAEFRGLSPNGQLRRVIEMQHELKALRFNQSVHKTRIEGLTRAYRESDAEVQRLRLAVAQRPPEGYSRPAIVRDLMEHAERAGWTVRYAWLEPDEHGDVMFDIQMRYGDGWTVKLSWCCQPGGKGRRVRSGLIRRPRRDWADAPSVVKLKEILTEAAQGG